MAWDQSHRRRAVTRRGPPPGGPGALFLDVCGFLFLRLAGLDDRHAHVCRAFVCLSNSCAEIGCALSLGTFLPPSAYRLGLPRGVDEWFKKAIAVRAEERFSSPADMLEAFERAIEPSTARDTPVSLELDLERLHEGWPSAVWKAIGAVAALAAVAVTVHAGMVERRATRALAAAAETRTTSAIIEARADLPLPPPPALIDSGTPAPAPPKATAPQPKKKAARQRQ